MPPPVDTQDLLHQHQTTNSARIQSLIDQQESVETTRSIVLYFSASSPDCAQTLGRALFAKGTRLLPATDPYTDGRTHIRVSVKRSLRDIVGEAFVTDLVYTAAGMNSTYDGWDILCDDSAEEKQQHTHEHNPQVY